MPFKNIEGVEVIHVDLSPNAAGETEALRWLSDAEHTRRSKFLHMEAMRRYTLCRAALRAILCVKVQCSNGELAFHTGRFGKPSAIVGGAPASINFNVSHSGRHGLIALNPKGRVGVDVEELVAPKGLSGLIESVLTPDEQADLTSRNPANQTQDFFRIWTIKEALFKGLGAGLSLDMSKIEVPIEMRQGSATGNFRFPESPETVLANGGLEHYGI